MGSLTWCRSVSSRSNSIFPSLNVLSTFPLFGVGPFLVCSNSIVHTRNNICAGLCSNHCFTKPQRTHNIFPCLVLVRSLSVLTPSSILIATFAIVSVPVTVSLFNFMHCFHLHKFILALSTFCVFDFYLQKWGIRRRTFCFWPF